MADTLKQDVLLVFKSSKPDFAVGLTDDELWGRIRQARPDLDDISFGQQFYEKYGEKLRQLPKEVVGGQVLGSGAVIPAPSPSPKAFGEGLELPPTDPFGSFISEASKLHGVDEKIIRAMIKKESGGDSKAVSPKGASGLMQLMPPTAKAMGVNNLQDPRENILGGTKYFKQMLDAQGGDIERALAAYNAGPGNVRKYGGIPPFPETQNYVKSIMSQIQVPPGEALKMQGPPEKVAAAESQEKALTMSQMAGSIASRVGLPLAAGAGLAAAGTIGLPLVAGVGAAAGLGAIGGRLVEGGEFGTQEANADILASSAFGAMGTPISKAAQAAKGILPKLAGYGAEGALLGGGETAARSVLGRGELPGGEELALGIVGGGVLGGLIGTGVDKGISAFLAHARQVGAPPITAPLGGKDEALFQETMLPFRGMIQELRSIGPDEQAKVIAYLEPLARGVFRTTGSNPMDRLLSITEKLDFNPTIKDLGGLQFEKSKFNEALESGEGGLLGMTALRPRTSRHQPAEADITLFKGSDARTLMHEIFHATEAGLPRETRQVLLKAFGTKEGAVEERARWFERFITTGRAPTPELKKAFSDMHAMMRKSWMAGGSQAQIFELLAKYPKSPEANEALKALFTKGASIIDTTSSGPAPAKQPPKVAGEVDDLEALLEASLKKPKKQAMVGELPIVEDVAKPRVRAMAEQAPPPPNMVPPDPANQLSLSDVYDFYRSGLAGKASAVANAFRSNLLAYTADTLFTQPLSSFGHLLVGDVQGAAQAARTAKNQALYLVPSFWNTLINARLAARFARGQVDVADLVTLSPEFPVVKALFGEKAHEVLSGGSFRRKAQESFRVIEKFSNPDEAMLLGRQALPDLKKAKIAPTAPTTAKKIVTGATRFNLVFNILQDTMYRMGYETAGHQAMLDTFNAGVAKAGVKANRLRDLLAISQGFDPTQPILVQDGKPVGQPLAGVVPPPVADFISKHAQRMLDSQINFINNKALKLTGAQRLIGDEKPLGSEMMGVNLDLMNNVARASKKLFSNPLIGLVSGELFPRYRFGNFMMTLAEANPFTAVLSPRARRSIQFEGKTKLLQELQSDYKAAIASSPDPPQTKPIQGDGETVEEWNARMLAWRKEQKEWIERNPNLVAQKKSIKVLNNMLKEWKREGLYDPGTVYANTMLGPSLVGVGMWLGMKREERKDHDLGPLQFRTVDGDGKEVIWDATQTFEALSGYILLGDIIYSKMIKSDRYQGPGKMIAENKFKDVFLKDRFNTKSFWDVLSARTSGAWEYMADEYAASLGSSIAQGGWLGDALRTVFTVYGGADEALVRDPKGFIEGMKSQVPVVKQGLRDWKKPTTGQPLTNTHPVMTLLLGRVNDPDQLRQFIDNHPGLISGSEILYRRTGVEDYDNVAFEELRKGLAKKVVPILNDEKMSHSTKAIRIKKEMVAIREAAHEQARRKFYREERMEELPPEMLIQQGMAEYEREALKRHPGREGLIPKWKRLRKYEEEAIREAGKDYIMKMYEDYEPPY